MSEQQPEVQDSARLVLGAGRAMFLPVEKTRRTFVPGVGYQAEKPPPVEYRHVNGRSGTPGNTPYVRPQAKPLSRKARRRRGLED